MWNTPKALVGAVALVANVASAMVQEDQVDASPDGVLTYLGRFSFTDTTSDEVAKFGYGGSFELVWELANAPMLGQKSNQMMFMWEQRYDELCTEMQLCRDLTSYQAVNKTAATRDDMCKAIANYRSKYPVTRDVC